MTKEEAFHYLGCQDIDDVEDAFDDAFFEYRSFFVSKVPFTKLFNAKIIKLQHLFEAKEFLLGKEIPVAEIEISLKDFSTVENVVDAFRLFGENEMNINLAIFQSKTYVEVEYYVNQLIENYSKNADCWKDGVSLLTETENVKMSIEPDVMKIYEELKRFNSLGLTKFTEINHLSDDNLLKQEAIRLYLWSKFEENV